METLMSILAELDLKIQAFPPEAHWLCPKISADDNVDYDDDNDEEDASAADKERRRIDAQKRTDTVYAFVQVFGLPPETDPQIESWIQSYKPHLDSCLRECDRCTKNWHMGRKRFSDYLNSEYDADTADAMVRLVQHKDEERIDDGIERAYELLCNTPEYERGMKLLLRNDNAALMSVYEALCCEPYHTARSKLNGSFGEVMRLVQSVKPLILQDVVPATTRFLFDQNESRHKFAVSNWTGKNTDHTMNRQIFAWAVQDSLITAIRMIAQPGMPLADVQRFWEGFNIILDKLNEDVIIHSLRGMDVQPDVYHLALQSLAFNSEAVLGLVIQAMRLLIEKSSRSFWSAYGSISPSTVAEQVFGSPAFVSLLSSQYQDASTDHLNGPPALSWIPPFIQSLGPSQQFEACRTTLSALLNRFQSDRIPEDAKIECFRAAQKALSTTLTTFTSEDYKISATTSFITIHNILGLVDQYKHIFIQCALLEPNSPGNQIQLKLGLEVIRLSLLLDCKAFRAEFSEIQDQKIIHHGVGTHSEPIWQAVLDAFRPNNMPMAEYILAGIAPLNGLDKFSAWRRDEQRRVIPLTADEIRFNKELEPLADRVSRIFARLSDFNPENLQQLFQNPETAVQIFAGLTPSDSSTYESAIEIIKTITGEDSRAGAISALLRDSLEPTLRAMFKAIDAASVLETFGAFPYIIKTSRDTLQALSDPQDGMLRTRLELTLGEKNAIKAWWKTQWLALSIAFRTTERWSNSQPADLMTNFVRDTMDFADSLFDQYSVLASALSTSASTDQSSRAAMSARGLCKFLLEPPRRAIPEILRWLRLRDPYLVSNSTNLVCKLLRRLGEFEMEIDHEAHMYLIHTLDKTVRTVLTGQQRAELRSALGEHMGVEIIEAPVATKTSSNYKSRNGVIDLESWSRASKSRADTSSRDSTVDLSDDGRSLTRNMDRNQSVLEQMRARQKPPTVPTAKTSSAPKINSALRRGESIKESRDREKREKAQRDKAAISAAKALRGESAIVAGEGSGLATIGGLVGKDHAPRQPMMVSSESEQSDDDDDDDANMLIKKIARKKGLAAGPKASAQEGPVKKKKIIRTAKDMRARLVPNMDLLHQTMLEWEIFHDGDDPPGGIDRVDVANTFMAPDSYRATFQPLLISEAWRSFKTAKDENNYKSFEMKIANRMSVDRFFEISTSIPIALSRELGIMEGDIVLLSRGKNPIFDREALHCLARVFRTTRKKDVQEISYRVSGKVAENKLVGTLAPNVMIFGAKITSMTTIEREYGALCSLEYYDLCDEILSARPSPILRYTPSDLGQVQTKYDVNVGQAKAILSAKDNDGFTLIQGPPGSGKTKTIVAMVGALMTDSFQPAGVALARPGMKTGTQPDAKPKKKLLLCAPSNAAVDELVFRLKKGVRTLKGEFHKIDVVRLGRVDAINSSVKDVTLDELVRKRLEGDAAAGKSVVSDREKLHLEAGKIKEALSNLRPKLDEARASGDKGVELKLQREFDIHRRNQARIGARIDEEKDNGNTAARDNELNRRRIQQQIIDDAHVLCATLSGSGHEMFKNLNVEFETVIIDEAAQCIELSALIPLKYGCSKCILVGDPKQLPPTVLSRAATKFGYDQSLFVRMQRNHPQDAHLLDTQYRMHPEISAFPSEQFYDGKLIDGPSMAKIRAQPWHASSLLGPYRFFDVKGTQSAGDRGHSFINVEEIRVAMKMYDRLKADYKNIDLKGKIGIITPYKAQLRQLRERFSITYGEDILEDIDFNTTDAFQGREAEIIIFSCVRAGTGGIGFLDDIRRMNVGLTRAKSSLWVLGDSNALMRGEFWAKLVNDAKARDRYTTGDITSMLKKPLSREDIKRYEASRFEVIDTVMSGVPELCKYCNRADHTDKACEDTEARRLNGGTCVRCGDALHVTEDCKAERCLGCGQFGHERDSCSIPEVAALKVDKVGKSGKKRVVDGDSGDIPRPVHKKPKAATIPTSTKPSPLPVRPNSTREISLETSVARIPQAAPKQPTQPQPGRQQEIPVKAAVAQMPKAAPKRPTPPQSNQPQESAQSVVARLPKAAPIKRPSLSSSSPTLTDTEASGASSINSTMATRAPPPPGASTSTRPGGPGGLAGGPKKIIKRKPAGNPLLMSRPQQRPSR